MLEKRKRKKIVNVMIVPGKTFRDGGTTVYIDKGGTEYFEDHRIGTKTKGMVYNKYPGDKNSHIVEVILKKVDTFASL